MKKSDIATEYYMISDSQKINELQLFETICPKLAADAVVIAEKLLQEKY